MLSTFSGHGEQLYQVIPTLIQCLWANGLTRNTFKFMMWSLSCGPWITHSKWLIWNICIVSKLMRYKSTEKKINIPLPNTSTWQLSTWCDLDLELGWLNMRSAHFLSSYFLNISRTEYIANKQYCHVAFKLAVWPRLLAKLTETGVLTTV